jgi:hypothetical protein
LCFQQLAAMQVNGLDWGDLAASQRDKLLEAIKRTCASARAAAATTAANRKPKKVRALATCVFVSCPVFMFGRCSCC